MKWQIYAVPKNLINWFLPPKSPLDNTHIGSFDGAQFKRWRKKEKRRGNVESK